MLTHPPSRTQKAPAESYEWGGMGRVEEAFISESRAQLTPSFVVAGLSKLLEQIL